MPTILEIRESYGEEQARIINACFDIAWEAGRVAEERVQGAVAAGAQSAARELRDAYSDEYLRLDVELREAIRLRVEEIEEISHQKTRPSPTWLPRVPLQRRR